MHFIPTPLTRTLWTADNCQQYEWERIERQFRKGQHMRSRLLRFAAATAAAAGLTLTMAGTAAAIDTSAGTAPAPKQLACAPGSAAGFNPTNEIAPVFEFPGTGEAFMSVPPGGQACVDGNTANGPDGVYRHFTGDGHTGPADGWIHERFVAF
ncbi:hypothetical protein HQ32_01863 [Prauserella sp. Am3]|nr:hypothetical protein HQ32_01863 [Prauserella sp. Am3]